MNHSTFLFKTGAITHLGFKDSCHAAENSCSAKGKLCINHLLFRIYCVEETEEIKKQISEQFYNFYPGKLFNSTQKHKIYKFEINRSEVSNRFLDNLNVDLNSFGLKFIAFFLRKVQWGARYLALSDGQKPVR